MATSELANILQRRRRMSESGITAEKLEAVGSTDAALCGAGAQERKAAAPQGAEPPRGVYEVTLHRLFEAAAKLPPNESAVVSLQLLEIYNETVVDLRARTGHASTTGEASRPVVEIRQSRNRSGGTCVPDAESVQLDTFEDARRILRRGLKGRVVASHNLNERSSRSHVVVSITCVRTRNDGTRMFGKMFLVDLAGSEQVAKSGVTGKQLQEAKHINTSLLALENVTSALAQRSRGKHVPYRASKLTYLLQPALTLSSRVLFYVTISPIQQHTTESIKTLQFGTRCRKVELGKVATNAELVPQRTPR